MVVNVTSAFVNTGVGTADVVIIIIYLACCLLVGLWVSVQRCHQIKTTPCIDTGAFPIYSSIVLFIKPSKMYLTRYAGSSRLSYILFSIALLRIPDHILTVFIMLC